MNRAKFATIHNPRAILNRIKHFVSHSLYKGAVPPDRSAKNYVSYSRKLRRESFICINFYFQCFRDPVRAHSAFILFIGNRFPLTNIYFPIYFEVEKYIADKFEYIILIEDI